MRGSRREVTGAFLGAKALPRMVVEPWAVVRRSIVFPLCS